MKLSSTDYNKILNNYNRRVPKTLKNKRSRAESLLARKMCSCVKKIKTRRRKIKKPGKIAICSKSIFKNRGLRFNRISCKKGSRFIKNKKTGLKLTKTRKKIF
jgi:hypothetical protein